MPPRYPVLIVGTDQGQFESKFTGKVEAKPILTLADPGPGGGTWSKKWIPNRTAWRVPFAAWGTDHTKWLGHGLTLFLGRTPTSPTLCILCNLAPELERGTAVGSKPAPEPPLANTRPDSDHGRAASAPLREGPPSPRGGRPSQCAR